MCKNPLEPSYIHCILIHDLQVVWWGKNINNLQVPIYLSHSVRFLFTRSAHPTFNNIPLHKDSLHGGLEYFFLQQMIKKKRTEANVQPCAMMYSIYMVMVSSFLPFMSSCHWPHLRASMDLMKPSLWYWPAPSQGHRLCLGCTHTLPAASQSYNRLWQKEEIYMVIQFFH